MLSHVSCAGSVAPLHTRWPAAQVSVPLAWHTPRAGVTDEQLPPASTAPLSTVPSQSMSLPSQISTPPLVLVQAYSQPSICLWLASKKPAAQSVAGLNWQVPVPHDAVA